MTIGDAGLDSFLIGNTVGPDHHDRRVAGLGGNERLVRNAKGVGDGAWMRRQHGRRFPLSTFQVLCWGLPLQTSRGGGTGVEPPG